MTPELLATGRRRYVSLTTFRRTGARVATPVWVAPMDDALVVLTGATSGKAKRLRNDPAVELQVCSARGRVLPGAPVVRCRAQLIEDPLEQRRPLSALAAKYGLQFRGFRLVEQVFGRSGSSADLVLRITDA